MKTEQQIRKLIEMLVEARDEPCQCAGTDHETECTIGGMLIVCQMDALLWVLGEISDQQITEPLVPPWKKN